MCRRVRGRGQERLSRGGFRGDVAEHELLQLVSIFKAEVQEVKRHHETLSSWLFGVDAQNDGVRHDRFDIFSGGQVDPHPDLAAKGNMLRYVTGGTPSADVDGVHCNPRRTAIRPEELDGDLHVRPQIYTSV